MPDPRCARREKRPFADGGCFHVPGLYKGHPMVRFDVPTAAGRQIFSIQCCGKNRDQLAAARSESGPVIVVFVDRDGKYFTDYGFPRINQLMLQVVSSLSRREEKLDVSSLKHLFHTASLEESSTSISSSSMWVRVFYNWGIRFYIRVDHRGCFHTYPHVGGPFHSLPEAYGAIDCYLRDREDPTLRLDPDDPDRINHVHESTRERAIRRILCWPDGTRKERLQSLPIDERRCWMLQMVRALVDKYNDDHNLLGDLAYELRDVVCYHVFNEGDINSRIYYHVNFTAKIEDNEDLLFFAEAIREGLGELVVSCICRINAFDKDKGHCYGCSGDVKHPKDDAYAGGHSSAGRLSCTYHSDGPMEDLGRTAAQLEEEEARVRYSHRGPRDPKFLEMLRTPVEVNYPPLRPPEEAFAFISQFFK